MQASETLSSLIPSMFMDEVLEAYENILQCRYSSPQAVHKVTCTLLLLGSISQVNQIRSMDVQNQTYSMGNLCSSKEEDVLPLDLIGITMKACEQQVSGS
jgi:hypothetical protein